MSALDELLAHAERGWQIFPLKPGSKKPATVRGFYDATTNPARLRRWFAQYLYNVGVRTGMASGVFVVDIDGEKGVASLRKIEAERGPLPATLTTVTDRGEHYWFAVDGSPIPSSCGRLGAGIDVKAERGYAVIPPSVHPSGARYSWRNEDLSPRPAPRWLIELARARPISERAVAIIRPPNGWPSSAYGKAALDREVGALAQVAPGGRNHALNRSAFNLGQLVAGGVLDRDLVIERLVGACHHNKLVGEDGMRSVLATIRSGLSAGERLPRGPS